MSCLCSTSLIMFTSICTHTLSSKWTSAKATTVPIHLLRSGWDDDLDLDFNSSFASFRSKRFSFFKKAESTRASTPSPPPEDDAVFAQSATNYLASSTAQSLRSPLPSLINMVQDHAPFTSPPNRPMVDTLALPATIGDGDSLRSSICGSILSADAWPRPPPTIYSPISPRAPAAIADLPCPPSPLSSRSSLGSTISDALGAIPAHLRDVPFNDTWTASGARAEPTQQRSRRHTPRRLPTRKRSRKNEAVYMTVVHETLAGP
jgi:hypothetical protein